MSVSLPTVDHHQPACDALERSTPALVEALRRALVSQLRATLTGKVRAGGRKPWLAMATNRLFPPIPHGGVL